jgi:hypothetical protein
MATVRTIDPGECTTKYLEGWKYAEWWIGKDGALIVEETPDAWNDEKANGFHDRLMVEKHNRQKAAIN